jgi:hypothetical protein
MVPGTSLCHVICFSLLRPILIDRITQKLSTATSFQGLLSRTRPAVSLAGAQATEDGPNLGPWTPPEPRSLSLEGTQARRWTPAIGHGHGRAEPRSLSQVLR